MAIDSIKIMFYSTNDKVVSSGNEPIQLASQVSFTVINSIQLMR